MLPSSSSCGRKVGGKKKHQVVAVVVVVDGKRRAAGDKYRLIRRFFIACLARSVACGDGDAGDLRATQSWGLRKKFRRRLERERLAGNADKTGPRVAESLSSSERGVTFMMSFLEFTLSRGEEEGLSPPLCRVRARVTVSSTKALSRRANQRVVDSVEG